MTPTEYVENVRILARLRPFIEDALDQRTDADELREVLNGPDGLEAIDIDRADASDGSISLLVHVAGRAVCLVAIANVGLLPDGTYLPDPILDDDLQ